VEVAASPAHGCRDIDDSSDSVTFCAIMLKQLLLQDSVATPESATVLDGA
jgi:hypothetical protein